MPFWQPSRSLLMRRGFLVTRRPRDMKQFYARRVPSPLPGSLVTSLFVSLAVKRKARLPILSPRCPDIGVPVVSIPTHDGIRRNARLMFGVFRRAAHVGGVESVLTVVSAGIFKDSVLLAFYLKKLSLKFCGNYLCFHYFLLVVTLPCVPVLSCLALPLRFPFCFRNLFLVSRSILRSLRLFHVNHRPVSRRSGVTGRASPPVLSAQSPRLNRPLPCAFQLVHACSLSETRLFLFLVSFMTT